MKRQYSSVVLEAGCDEAGRGCLAGPVFAAAVILPPGFELQGINDSKKLSSKQREAFRKEIESQCIWSVASCSTEEIETYNILWAAVKAMHKALEGLHTQPEMVVVDGNRFKPWEKVPYVTQVQGDGLFMNIAAASILAKTHRDSFMTKLHESYPEYGWKKNKGYGTQEHRQAIEKWGLTPWHRKGFKCFSNQQSLPLF